jgi:hypothetical protein
MGLVNISSVCSFVGITATASTVDDIEASQVCFKKLQDARIRNRAFILVAQWKCMPRNWASRL